MDKLERLLNLTAALLHAERPLTAEQLRDLIGGYPEGKAAFRRAFERDKDALRGMGMPLDVQTVPGTDPPVEGYRLDRDEYAGTDLRFEPDELAALHLATSLVRLDGAADGDTALIKLGAADGPDAPDDLGRVPFDETLARLVGAAAQRRAVGFHYNGTERTVEPWRLSFSRGHWYLAGWDRSRDAERLFRVDRLESEVELQGPAEHPAGTGTDPLDLRGWELGDGAATAVRLRVDADQAGYARHILGTVEDGPDGSIVAELQVRNPEALHGFVVSFLEHAEILGPPEARAAFVDWLEGRR